MNFKNSIKYLSVAAVFGLGMASCDDFLDRPAEDTYTSDGYYKTDEQCYAGVNFLYSSPWYDFSRGFISTEVLAGNLTWTDNIYYSFSVNGNDENLRNSAYSLWSVVAYANTVYDNLAKASASPEVIATCQGECLTWKAMAYFYLVRYFGDVPLIHNNSEEIEAGTYNSKRKVMKDDIYEYIVMTLEKAMELLPKQNIAGRLDYYSAEALLAKVYLTRAGVGQTGTREQADLDAAARYAKDVIDNSGRHLLDNYADNFRLANNINSEELISWRWTVSSVWTTGNAFQSDLAPQGFDNFQCWGGYRGISVDLQDAFNVSALADPSTRIGDRDTRRKATMMLPGDVYEYFWADKGGFDPLRFSYDNEYAKGSPGQWQAGTGAYNVKHLHGNTADHIAGVGFSDGKQASALATHLLRLSDIYLVYAEAVLGNNASTSEAGALEAYNAVRSRAIDGLTPATSITFDDIWKERRLELAMEGDRWFDYVRLSYYDTDRAIRELKAMRRNTIWNVDGLYKYYFENGVWDLSKAASAAGTGEAGYDTTTPAPNVTADSFTMPFPNQDVVFNPALMEDPIHVDVRETFAY